MEIYYLLNKDIISREAAQLNWKLNQLPITIYIKNNFKDKIINGKSLIGILSGNVRYNDKITIMINDYHAQFEIDKIKEYFNEVGREINGG